MKWIVRHAAWLIHRFSEMMTKLILMRIVGRMEKLGDMENMKKNKGKVKKSEETMKNNEEQ